MERVLGVGGVFFKARDPKALAEWYATHLGVPFDAGQTYGTFTAAAGDQTVWSMFPEDTKYFAPSEASYMFNFRVRNLAAMLRQLRAAGVPVDGKVEEFDYGNFGWVMDPEGNRIELWEPKTPF
jgi:predicted enzyme related to lactoylglutathione lyase